MQRKRPHGNILITESYAVCVCEIMSDGEIAWKFYGCEADIENKRSGAIYRVVRIIDPENYSFLKRLK